MYLREKSDEEGHTAHADKVDVEIEIPDATDAQHLRYVYVHKVEVLEKIVPLDRPRNINHRGHAGVDLCKRHIDVHYADKVAPEFVVLAKRNVLRLALAAFHERRHANQNKNKHHDDAKDERVLVTGIAHRSVAGVPYFTDCTHGAFSSQQAGLGGVWRRLGPTQAVIGVRTLSELKAEIGPLDAPPWHSPKSMLRLDIGP